MQQLDHAREVAVTALGLGKLPGAPGTWCSIGCAAVYTGLRLLSSAVALGAAGCLLAVSAGLGFWLGGWAADHYGEPDPSPFVLDEAAGFWLAAMLFWHPDWVFATAGILMGFRFFDIVKPFPLRRLEKLQPPVGIMVDDLGAGIYTAGLLWSIRYLS